MNWLDYPTFLPIKSGYYMTKYIWEDVEYRKAIWYNSTINKWIDWRPSNRDLLVNSFESESFNDYYVPCEMEYEEKYRLENTK